MDLLMVRDRTTGRFVYTERLERRAGKTPWEYVRREGRIRARFNGETVEVLVGWGVGSVEEFFEAYPEYQPKEPAEDEGLEGGKVDQ